MDILIRRSALLGCTEPGGGKRHLLGLESNVPSVDARPRNGVSFSICVKDEQESSSSIDSARPSSFQMFPFNNIKIN